MWVLGKEGKRWRPQGRRVVGMGRGKNWFGSMGLFLPQKVMLTQKEGPERKESLDYVKNKERDRHSKPQSGGGWGNRTKWGAILLVRAECEVIGFDKATGPSKCRPKVV